MKPICPHCGDAKTYINAYRRTMTHYKCGNCKKYFSIKNAVKQESEKDTNTYEEGDNFINIVCSSKRVLNKDDIIKQFNIDTDVWKVERFKIKTSEGYRKDKKSDLIFENGVMTGSVNDSGKMLVVPLYHVEVRLIKKKEIADAKIILTDLINDAKKFSPKYVKIKYAKIKDKFLLEPDMPDLHYGKLAWHEESGDNYDIKIAEKLALDAIESMIRQSSAYSIDRILFPIGNDYFNVNNKLNMTSHNTPQQEDVRWQKTFKLGRQLAIKMIDILSQIAPVDVLIVPGNHDEERTFYLGDALECWYNNSPNVTVDNRALKRKYYSYGKNLIGFTHGYYEKLNELPLIMSLEQPELWSKCQFREWQTGDKHHKKEIKTSMKENEQKGVMVRILRSLSGNDAWHFDKGYIGQTRAAEAFIRHRDKGLIAQFISVI